GMKDYEPDRVQQRCRHEWNSHTSTLRLCDNEHEPKTEGNCHPAGHAHSGPGDNQRAIGDRGHRSRYPRLIPPPVGRAPAYLEHESVIPHEAGNPMFARWKPCEPPQTTLWRGKEPSY